MYSSEHIDGLRDVVTVARDDVSEILGILAMDEDGDSEAALDIILGQLDNVAMAAEIAEMPGLKCVTEEIGKHFRPKQGEDRESIVGRVRDLMVWSDDLLCFLQKPGDSSLAQKLLRPLPDARHSDLLNRLTGQPVLGDELSTAHEPVERFEQFGFSEEATESGDASDPAHSSAASKPSEPIQVSMEPASSEPVEPIEPEADAADDDSVHQLLMLVVEEFSEAIEQLSSLVESLCCVDASTEQIEITVGQYKEIVTRMMVASDALGMEGVKAVCAFVIKNVGAIPSIDQAERPALEGVLEHWPLLLIAYVSAPGDKQSSLDLVGILEESVWPEPLDEVTGPDLLANLASGLHELAEFAEVEEETRQKQASPEDVALEIADDVKQELIDAFFHEAPAHAVELTERIGRAVAGDDTLEQVLAAQRLAHTLKGAGNLVGAKGVANLTHHLEDILEYLAQHKAEPPPALAVTLEEAADCIEAMIDCLQGVDVAPADSLRILQDVLDWANRIDRGQIDDDAPVTRDLASGGSTERTEAADEVTRSSEPVTAKAETAAGPAASSEVLRIPTNTVDEMFRLVGEVAIAMGQIKERLKQLTRQAEGVRTQNNIVQQRRFDLENQVDIRSLAAVQRRLSMVGQSGGNFDPLEMDRYDELYGVAHSFIEAVADARELSFNLENQLATLDSLFAQHERTNRELQQVITSSRMVPASNITSRLQRSMRQTCRAIGRQAELTIEGADMLMDSDVLGKLTDPLMHMLRNAVDHGIEPSEERETKGKSPVGRITLCFRQDGNSMLVRCEDDGRGLNYQQIRQTAVKRGLLEGSASLVEEELGRLVLLSGFSTRDSVTQVSGRGVGLDVVHNSITALKGAMDIRNGDRDGCTISLRLPITLITSHCVLVRVANERFAIPTLSLEQILSPASGQISAYGPEVTYQLAKDVYSARSLASLLAIDVPESLTVDHTKTVLLVRADSSLVALTVDEVLDSYDLVLKSTGRYVKSIRGVSGVSVLGDGGVVPVLDPPALLRVPVTRVSAGTTAVRAAGSRAKPSIPRILIVDDSLSVRKSLSLTVTDAGYEALLAHDGLEAVELLDEHDPQLIIADLEMPRMNGLELTDHVRGKQGMNQLPIIMVTSRSMQKHREQAKAVGVDVYMTKPYSEDDLLSNVHTLLQRGRPS